MSTGEILSRRQAHAILGLSEDAPMSTWRAAFQRAVKAAHPDRGGDSERVRIIIEAYRFLKTEGSAPRSAGPKTARPAPRAKPAPRPQAQAQPQPQPAPPPEPEARSQATSAWTGEGKKPGFPISVVEAFRGCEKMVWLEPRRKFRVRLPPGLQTGDMVRFGAQNQHYLIIEVAKLPGCELRGADLWLTVSVSTEFMREGGRVAVETPMGPRHFWVSRTSAARGLFRAPGEGLPARSSRPKGHLYLRFEADAALDQSPSRSLLKRFAAAWAAA